MVNSSEILRRSEGMDLAIQHEKSRIKAISWKFEVIDAAVAIIFLPLFMIMARITNPDDDVPNQSYEHFEWIFILFTAILLAWSAYYLSKNIKRLTSKN